jgi:hypothetical protein
MVLTESARAAALLALLAAAAAGGSSLSTASTTTCETCAGFRDASCQNQNYTLFSECNCGGGGCDCASCCPGSAVANCCGVGGPSSPGCAAPPPPPLPPPPPPPPPPAGPAATPTIPQLEEQPHKSFCAEDGWVHTWSDEFDGESLDKSSWRLDLAGGDSSVRDAQGTEEDVYLEDGALVLRTQRRKMGKYNFSSGAVQGNMPGSHGR